VKVDQWMTTKFTIGSSARLPNNAAERHAVSNSVAAQYARTNRYPEIPPVFQGGDLC
jgi:hypothetical protein